MSRHLVGIDHAIVAVRDLAAARTAYERLGFVTTPRGRHTEHGTANHCIMFPDDYLELLGVAEPGAQSREIERFLAEREGLIAIALGSSDPEATRAAWAELGLEPDPVSDFARRMEPDLELRFRDVMLDRGRTGGIPMFACSALSPDLMRQNDWLEHPNRARRIESVTVVVDEPAAYAAPMAAVFGATNLTDTDDTLAVHTGRGVLLLVTADDMEIMHPELETVALQGQPVIAALSILVDDIGATAALLDEQGVPYRRDASGAIGVRPEEAHGVRLEFTAAARASRFGD